MAGDIFNRLHKNSSIFLKLALFYAKKKSAYRFFFQTIHLLSIWNLNCTLHCEKANQLALNLF